MTPVAQLDDRYSIEAFRGRLGERLAQRSAEIGRISGDQVLNEDYAAVLKDREFTPAAVLIALFEHEDGATVLLTQRSSTLRSHSGQVAFPGGKIDEGETAEEAALREAREEVGLPELCVDILGTMGPYFSGSGYRISPVIGVVSGSPELVANDDEVAEIFQVPLSFLMDKRSHQIESRTWQNKERFFYTMPFHDRSVDPPVERYIWGVTAGIIRTVQERLYG